MTARKIVHIKSIAEFHRLRGLPKPMHPLISIVDYSQLERPSDIGELSLVFDFYQISIKRGTHATLRYGQQSYDFDDGVLFFGAPNQVLNIQPIEEPSASKRTGWLLLIHPDFLWNTTLGNTIRNYAFFDYSVNEALWLSDKEEKKINSIIRNIKQEYEQHIDDFSKQIIVHHIETLLSYSQRFYHRQFLTREKSNQEILSRMETILNDYFNSEAVTVKGLPTVEYIAQELHTTPKYLSSMLKVLTGQTTQQVIHEKLIEKAKEKLSTTDLSVSEIAYELGFEHPQSFSKLFKTKTNQSPLEFRARFN